ncbi:MAG: YggS family pyridoxal phosphate-dependent enzyme [Ginsengibacter sp.]
MPVNLDSYHNIKAELKENTKFVAVSKTQFPDDILKLYEAGQRDFGENYVQELVDKSAQLPDDIYWHFIGHLQSNKVKYIAPFVGLIQSVDSFKLLQEINKQALKQQRKINCLLQVHIAMEENKFGMTKEEIFDVLHKSDSFENINICGLMGMASFTSDQVKVKQEFRTLKEIFIEAQVIQKSNCNVTILSMGMSGDYKFAIEEGSNMIRIGSLIFGERNKT